MDCVASLEPLSARGYGLGFNYSSGNLFSKLLFLFQKETS
jgi:hypothetical protein